MYYFVVASFMFMIIWLIVLVVLTVPVVTQKQYLMTRFVFLAIPTCYVIMSLLIGMLAGTFGPLAREAREFAYYQTMWNVYLAILIVGYWPVEEKGFAIGNARDPDEEASIISFEKKEPSADSKLLQKK